MVVPLDCGDTDSRADSRATQLALETHQDGRRFRIEHDAAAGYYLYVFDGARCTHDHLQDSLRHAKAFAHEEFGVPEDAWADATPTI